MRKIEELQKQIEQKQRELDKLLAQKEQLESLGPAYLLAVELHDKLCHSNHADGCGWFYEIKDGEHQWERRAHVEYLEKAKNVLAIEPNVDRIIAIANAL